LRILDRCGRITSSDTPYPYKKVLMSSSTYVVTGMTCGGCASKVKTAVASVPGVSAVDVELATGQVTVTGEQPVDGSLVRTAVVDAGYQVKEQVG
jgi:copper chaperone